MIDRNTQSTSYSYDAVGNLTGEQWRSGASIIYRATYTYDALNQLTAAADNNSSYHYAYDATTELMTKVDNVGTPGAMPTVTFTLDLNTLGLRRTITDSLTHAGKVSYTYDNALNLKTLTFAVDGTTKASASYSYDAANRLTAIARTEPGLDPITSSFDYDDANRLTTIDHETPLGPLSEFDYDYDAAGRITSYTGTGSGMDGTKTYAYDATDQLTTVMQSGSVLESFSYDAAGNRTGGSYGVGTGNRITADGTYTYSYDTDGNTLQRTQLSNGHVQDYTWDYRNRLTEVKERSSAGGTIVYDAQYTYDVFDRRIGVNEDADGSGAGAAVQTWTLYDGANAWADFDAGGSLTMRYMNGLGMDDRVARISAAGAVRWYLTDLVNSVRQIADSFGSVSYSANYSAFGMIGTTSGSGGDRFKYTGREWDAGTGQYLYRARYYGADVGKFRSEDPVGFAAGDANLYRYVGNNATNKLDPTGHNWADWLVDHLPQSVVDYLAGPVNSASNAGGIAGYFAGGAALPAFYWLAATGPIGWVTIGVLAGAGATWGVIEGTRVGSSYGNDAISGAGAGGLLVFMETAAAGVLLGVVQAAWYYDPPPNFPPSPPGTGPIWNGPEFPLAP